MAFLWTEWCCRNGQKIRKATCKLCENVSLAYSSGTTNLHHQLKVKHPSEIKKTDEDSHKQMALPVVKKFFTTQSSKITSLIAEFVSRDMHPISSIDGSGFQLLLQCMEPTVVTIPPSCPFITSTCHWLYLSLKEKYWRQWHCQKWILLLWMGLSVESYLTLYIILTAIGN